MRVGIIANGEIDNDQWLLHALKGFDELICADGGANHLARLGVFPDLIIGDLDSIEPQVEEKMQSAGVPMVRYPVEKDQTDLELALITALQHGADQICIFAAQGGRLDHSLAVVLLLAADWLAHKDIAVVDEAVVARVMRKHLTIKGRAGRIVSLLPLSEKVSGVTLTGMRYPLQSAELKLGSPLSVSNEMLSDAASIHIDNGILLVLVNQDIPSESCACCSLQGE